MKTLNYVSAVLIFCATACNNDNQSKDSVDSAMQINKSIDSTTMNDTTGKDLKKDKDFMVKAASGGLLEVALGKMALANAASQKVKDFGQMMITDHTKANNELITLAQQKNIVVPSTPGEDEQKHIDKLAKEKGKDFDKDYVSLMIDDHKKDIEEFQHEVDNAEDSSIQVFAERTLPVLRKHLEHIQAIQDAIK